MDENAVAMSLDAVIAQVRAKIPEASAVSVGREHLFACDGPMWVVTISVPRRTKNFRVMANKWTRLSEMGETLDKAVHRAWLASIYNATGKFPEHG